MLKSTGLRALLPYFSYVMILMLTGFFFLVFSLTTKNFFSYSNIYSMLFGVSIQFFVIIGFTCLMIMGEIDLSVGSMYGFGGALLGYLIIVYKISFIPAFLLTFVAAMLIGWGVGTLVVRLRLNSMMITLGVLMALQGAAWMLINTYGSRSFGRTAGTFAKFRIWDINWTVLALAVLPVVLEILLHTNILFRKMYYIGQSDRTATIYGVKSGRIKIAAFAASAALACFGGMLATCRLGSAHVSTGAGLEFTMVTAAVLGGSSLYGGKGSILLSVVGLFFLTMLQNGMTAYSIEPFTQKITQGAILIIVVLFDIAMNRKKR